MRPEDPIAPVLSRSASTILPSAVATPGSGLREPPPGIITNPIQRHRASLATTPLQGPLRQAAIPAPAVPKRVRALTPRQQALRSGAILQVAHEGADLLRRVAQGHISADEALTDYRLRTQNPGFSPKVTAQLGSDFTTALQKAVRRSQNRRPLQVPAAQVPSPDNAVSRPGLDERVLDVASQGVSGANIGLAQMMGLPVDTSALVLNLLSLGVKVASGIDMGQIDRPILGSEQIQEFLETTGAITPPNDDRAGQIARRIGESVGANAIPAAGAVAASAKLVQQLGRNAIPLVQQIARAPGRALAVELGASTAGGIGAATANQIAPDSVAADIAGETIGSLLGAGGAAVTARTVRNAASSARSRREPARLIPGRTGLTRHARFNELFDGGVPTKSAGLRRNMIKDESLGLKNAEGWAAHHMIPWELRGHKLIRRLGMNMNHPDNGIALPQDRAGNLSRHFDFHPSYNDAYNRFLGRLDWALLTNNEKRALLVESIEQTRAGLISGDLPLSPDSAGAAEKWAVYFRELADDMGLPTDRVDD